MRAMLLSIFAVALIFVIDTYILPDFRKVDELEVLVTKWSLKTDNKFMYEKTSILIDRCRGSVKKGKCRIHIVGEDFPFYVECRNSVCYIR